MVGNHQTSIYKWLFGVPGSYGYPKKKWPKIHGVSGAADPPIISGVTGPLTHPLTSKLVGGVGGFRKD